MRSQKPKKRINSYNSSHSNNSNNTTSTNSSIKQNRFKDSYLNNIDCKYCVNYRGRKRGCILSMCDFEEEKMDVIKYSRIKRKVGDAV